jgi:hypothetical protein
LTILGTTWTIIRPRTGWKMHRRITCRP